MTKSDRDHELTVRLSQVDKAIAMGGKVDPSDALQLSVMVLERAGCRGMIIGSVQVGNEEFGTSAPFGDPHTAMVAGLLRSAVIKCDMQIAAEIEAEMASTPKPPEPPSRPRVANPLDVLSGREE